MFIELVYWEGIWCKFSVWNIEIYGISPSVNSMQLSNSSTLYVETSVKGHVQQHKNISVTLAWSFLICHPWHIIYFLKFSRHNFKTRNIFERFSEIFFCFVLFPMTYKICSEWKRSWKKIIKFKSHSERQKIEREWVHLSPLCKG